MSTFDQASLVMIPSGYKTSKVYSIKPTDGSGDLDFSRSNDTATRVNSAGLIEKVRTNVALYSEQFDNAYWGKANVTVTANTTVNPVNGATTADTLTRTGGASGFLNRQIAQTGIVTFSIFAKAGTTNQVRLNIYDGSTDRGATYNLTTGAISSVYGSPLFTTAQSFGSGWYRISISVNAASYTDCQVQVDSVNSVIIFGAQLETSDIATDYIATTSAAVSVGPVANVPRLDYLNSSCPRLLLEGQRVNLFQFSEQIDNAYWTKTNSTITANSVTSPDGYTNADTLTASGSGSVTHVITRAITTTSGSVYAFSVFAKKGNTDFIALRHDSGGTFNYFNINTGTKGATCDASATIENYGNGWYRCTVFHTATGSNGGEIYLATANGVVSFAAAGQFAYIYGAQYELGAYATSYIPTLGAAVTRGADACSKTGISSLIGQTEGTVFVDWQIDSMPSIGSYFTFLLTQSSGNIMYVAAYADGRAQAAVFVGNVLQCNLISSTGFITAGANKFAFGYKANDFVLYANGTQVATDTSGSVPAATSIDLADTSGGKMNYNQAILFPTRLSNADLAALTA